MPTAIKAPPWSTPQETAKHDEELQRFEAWQIQRYGSASYRFWSHVLPPFALGIIMATAIMYAISLI